VIYKKGHGKKEIKEDQSRSLYLDLPLPEPPKTNEDKKEKTIPRGIWEVDL